MDPALRFIFGMVALWIELPISNEIFWNQMQVILIKNYLKLKIRVKN